MPKPKYDRKKCIDTYLKYRSLDKAAKEIGCAKSTLHGILKRAGINPSGEWKHGGRDKEENDGSVSEAVKSGDKRKILIAMRDKLAKAIDTCESDRDLPALTKRFWEVIDELEHVPDPETKKLSKHDRLKQRAQR